MQRITLKKAVWGAGLLGIGCLSLWLGGGNWLAAQQEHRAQQDWAQFVAQFAKPQANSSALTLEALTAELGINLLGIEIRDRVQPDPAKQQQFDRIREPLQVFLEQQLENPTDDLDPLPASLQQYLSVHADQLAAIRQHLLSEDQPVWELTSAQLNVKQPLPTFLGVIQLQRLLVLEMLEQHRAGQTQAALNTLEASWKLDQALRDRPDLTSQLATLIVTKIQAGGIRKLDHLPSVWQQRLFEHDYRQSFLTSLDRETWLAAELIRRSGLPAAKTTLSWRQQLSSLWLQPYVRLSALDSATSMKRAFAQLPQKNVCQFDAMAFDRNLAASRALWNLEGEDISAGLAHQWRTAGQLMVDLELTQKILQAKAIAAEQGQWPPTLDHLTSLVCPRTRWIYQVEPNGTLLITFSQRLERPAQQYPGLVLPLRYSAKTKRLNLDLSP